jgi:putative membrane protein
MGPLANHMAMHILLMNFFAPAAAIFASVICPRREPSVRALILATTAQLAGLWMWHAPPLLNRVLASVSLHLLMYGSLFLIAFLFWSVVLRFEGSHRWKPILSLLVTSKLYCLLAVLFVFAPRALYADIAGHHSIPSAPALNAALADQQLAGLIMLVACVATYVLAGIAISARWLFALEAVAVDRPNAGEEVWT